MGKAVVYVLTVFSLIMMASTAFVPGVMYEMYNIGKGRVVGVTFDFQDDFQSPIFCAFDPKTNPNVDVRRAAFFIEPNPLHPDVFQVIEAERYLYLYRGDQNHLIGGPHHNVVARDNGQFINDPKAYWKFNSVGDVFDEFFVVLDGKDLVMEQPEQAFVVKDPVLAVNRQGGKLNDAAKWRIYESMSRSVRSVNSSRSALP